MKPVIGLQPVRGLGRRIQALREQRGLSVQELADRAGTTYQSIWRIERGEQKDPSIALTRAIARTLGVGVDHLINMFGKDEDSELFPAGVVSIGV
jgi:transcriptional regulator with XRE-family HTH domain